MMTRGDEQLSALLKQWREIEPSSNFEAGVWRQIRAARTSEPERVTYAKVLAQWLREALWRPGFSLGAAALIGAMIGTAGGVFSVPEPPERVRAPMQFLGADTLAGSYTRLASEADR